MDMRLRSEVYPLATTFTISRGSKSQADVVVVEVEAGGHLGRGECVPYPRYGETVEAVLTTLEELRPAVARGLDHQHAAGSPLDDQAEIARAAQVFRCSRKGHRPPDDESQSDDQTTAHRPDLP